MWSRAERVSRRIAMLLLAAASCSQPLNTDKPALIAAAASADIAPLVAHNLATARDHRARLLVYVGAKWCEPCRRFHDALSAGELDASLRGVRFLEFDYDVSRDALARAGYQSQLIPLFALPKPDGSASGQFIEGSIKGPSAVQQNLLPRLHALLQPTAAKH
jgi:thiol-disulfide isomerase/thioredoxin